MAGLVDIPPVRFGVLSLIGTVVYVIVLSSIGYSLGSEWSKINHGLTLATYVLVAVVVVAIIGFVLYRLREFRREAAAGAARSESTNSRERLGRYPARLARHHRPRSASSYTAR